jgi:hypothetical protein
VYLNEKVLAIQSLYYDRLKEELLSKVENLENEENVCDFIKKIYGAKEIREREKSRDGENIYEGLNIQKIRKENRKRKSEYVPVMRFGFEGDDLNEQLKEEIYNLPLVEINSNSNCYKVVWKTPLNFYVIQYNSKSDRQSLITALKESFDTVRKFLEGIKDRDNGAGYIEHKRDVIERIGKKYIEQALKIFFNSEDIRWEWKHTSFLRSYFNFPDAVIGFADDVIEFYKNNITSKFDEKHNETSESHGKKMKSTKKELEAKLEVVKKLKKGEKLVNGEPDILCIAISNLIAYSRTQEQYIKEDIENRKQKNQSRQQLMEIDGLILGLTEKQLFICLIEAKSGNEDALRTIRSKVCDRRKDIFRGYDISNLINSAEGLDDKSIAYLIITD